MVHDIFSECRRCARYMPRGICDYCNQPEPKENSMWTDELIKRLKSLVDNRNFFIFCQGSRVYNVDPRKSEYGETGWAAIYLSEDYQSPIRLDKFQIEDFEVKQLIKLTDWTKQPANKPVTSNYTAYNTSKGVRQSTKISRSSTGISALVMWLGDNVTAATVGNCLKKAITEWINTTEEGHNAWKQSLFQFNIGDLSQYNLSYGDTTNPLYQILLRHGIKDLIIDVFTDNWQDLQDWDFDTVLVEDTVINKD
jgi:hypothetical protein